MQTRGAGLPGRRGGNHVDGAVIAALRFALPMLPSKESAMRKALVLIAGTVFAATAWANNCPNDMKAIDAKLATKPALSKDVADKVTKLRADGEAQHKAGKHDESMKSLGEAKKLLGI
jgi:hypothetical protein